jgi:hypothetical protein
MSNEIILNNPKEEQMKDNWGEILSLILGGALYYGLKKIIDDWKYKKREKQKSVERELTVEAFQDYIHLEKIFADLLKETQIQRVCFFVGCNSGNIPVFGSPYYAQCLLADSIIEGEKYKIIDNYNKVLVDANYCGMLINIMKNGSQVLKVSEIEDSLLKRLYIREGVKYSEMYFLDNHNKKIYYMTFATYQDVCEFDDNTKSHIDMAISSIKQMIIKSQDD